MAQGIAVHKYGGSSVATIERIQKVAKHIKAESEKGQGVVAVVSAMGDETDGLIQFAKDVAGSETIPQEELNKLLVTGEMKSAPALAIALHAIGVDAVSLTGLQVGLETDPVERKIKRVRNAKRIRKLLSQGKTVVIAGFQGVIEGTDDVTTLGRGGSDLTAIAIAGALRLPECKIYTDVDGVYAIDPRLVPHAKKFDSIVYSQMIQLSGAGAGVLMDRSVVLAQNLGVTIHVMKSPSLGASTGGTLVHSGSTLEEMEGFWLHAGVAIQKGSLVKIADIPNKPGMVVKIFDALTDINLIDSAQVHGAQKADVGIFCATEDVVEIAGRLQNLSTQDRALRTVSVSEGLAVAGLTLVYAPMKEEPNYLLRVTRSMAKARVNIEMFSSAGTTILAVVKEEDLGKAAESLGEEFELLEPL